MDKIVDGCIGKNGIHFVLYDLSPGSSEGYCLFITDDQTGSILTHYEFDLLMRELDRILELVKAAGYTNCIVEDKGYRIKPLVQVRGVTCEGDQVFVHGIPVDESYFVEIAEEADNVF
jgi:hypothetical protein